MTIEKAIHTFNVSNYIPVVSTGSSLVILAIKITKPIIEKTMSYWTNSKWKLDNQLTDYLRSKSIVDLTITALPFIGNIYIGTKDYVTYQNTFAFSTGWSSRQQELGQLIQGIRGAIRRLNGRRQAQLQVKEEIGFPKKRNLTMEEIEAESDLLQARREIALDELQKNSSAIPTILKTLTQKDLNDFTFMIKWFTISKEKMRNFHSHWPLELKQTIKATVESFAEDKVSEEDPIIKEILTNKQFFIYFTQNYDSTHMHLVPSIYSRMSEGLRKDPEVIAAALNYYTLNEETPDRDDEIAKHKYFTKIWTLVPQDVVNQPDFKDKIKTKVPDFNF